MRSVGARDSLVAAMLSRRRTTAVAAVVVDESCKRGGFYQKVQQVSTAVCSSSQVLDALGSGHAAMIWRGGGPKKASNVGRGRGKRWWKYLVGCGVSRRSQAVSRYLRVSEPTSVKYLRPFRNCGCWVIRFP